MPSIDAKINDYITRSFRDVADEDYIGARALYRVGLDIQFLWLALQAVEKYLKSILLYHRINTKDLIHNISCALDRVQSIEHLSFEIPSDVARFIRQLSAQGINRYFEQPVNTNELGLLELDKTVWYLRKYCRSVRRATAGQWPINGRLEEIRSKPSRAREDLVWKNLYFGRYRKIKFSRRVKWGNPSNFLYPGIFPQLDKLIRFSRPVREHFLRRQGHGKQRRVSAITEIEYTRPSASYLS